MTVFADTQSPILRVTAICLGGFVKKRFSFDSAQVKMGSLLPLVDLPASVSLLLTGLFFSCPSQNQFNWNTLINYAKN